MSEQQAEIDRITEALARPFRLDQIHFKPQTVSKDGNRCLAIVYIDARTVQDRLDEVFGLLGWSDEYDFLPNGSVVCRLRVRVGVEWVVKTDVGGQSDQSDEGDRTKSAVSDALKRAAVKLGVARYIYRIPQTWTDYDPKKKQIAGPPALPAWALPPGEKQEHPARKPAAAPAAPAPEKKKSSLPADGEELMNRLAAFDKKLAGDGLCKPGDLLAHVRMMGGSRYGYSLTEWSGPAIRLAVDEARAFQANRKAAREQSQAARPEPEKAV